MERTITELSVQKNNAKRCNLYLDGKFFCGIELITVMQNRLKVGDKILEERLRDILEQSEREQAMNKAVAYVSKGMHTAKQVERYLKDKKYPDFIVKQVLQRLIDVGYIDDGSFAKSYVNGRKNVKGARLLKAELKLKGVAESVIDEALEGFSEDDGALNVARRFLSGKELSFENVSKCYRRLLSKGFDYDTANEAVEVLKREYEDNQA
ncbi:MAG: RecX family transcriptional regulator [Christensenellaceae bacterium]